MCRIVRPDLMPFDLRNYFTTITTHLQQLQQLQPCYVYQYQQQQQQQRQYMFNHLHNMVIVLWRKPTSINLATKTTTTHWQSHTILHLL